MPSRTLRSTRRSPPPSATSTARASTASSASTRPARSPSSAAPSRCDYTVARDAAAAFYARLRELFAAQKSITTFGPYSPGQAVTIKRMGIEGIYLGGWATSAKGSLSEDPGTRPRQLPAEPGPRRGRRAGARTAHRGPQSAVPAAADDRRATRRDACGRLPAVHHRRRRYRPRWRPARAQPHPPLRRSRCAGLPHRGPTSRHEEVRPSGREGPGAVRRTDQAPQHRPLPARRHAGARHHRRPHGRRGGQPDREPRRRARSAVHPRRDESEGSAVQGLLPGPDAQLLRRGGHRPQGSSPLRPARRRVRRRRCLAGAPWHHATRHRGGGIVAGGRRSIGRRSLRQGREPVRRRMAGRRRPRDLRRGGGRTARVPRARGRAARREGRRMAEVRGDRVAVRRPREGQGARRRRSVGLRAGQDARGLLPGARRHPVCDRQVAGGGAVRRHPLDGDQDRRPRRRQGLRQGDPRRLPGQDDGLQPVPLVQLGHHRHDRRPDAGLPRGDRRRWASSSTS